MKSFLVELMVDNLMETPSGILLIMAGGWLDEVETYVLLAFGLMKGLVGPSLRSRMISKKSINLVLHSVVTLHL